MTIAAVIPRVVYQGTSIGTLGPFAVSNGGTAIYFESNADIIVTRYASTTANSGTVLVEGTDYDLTGGPDAGSITLTSPQTGLLDTERLVIERAEPVSQDLDIGVGGSFSASDIERRFDKTTRMIQDLKAQVDRTVAGHFLDTGPLTLPANSVRKGKIAVWDATTGQFAASTLTAEQVGAGGGSGAALALNAVQSFATLKATDTGDLSDGTYILLNTSYNGGLFVLVSSDLSLFVTAGGSDAVVAIPNDRAANGSEGGWVRLDWWGERQNLNMRWFGLVPDEDGTPSEVEATSNRTAAQNCVDFLEALLDQRTIDFGEYDGGQIGIPAGLYFVKGQVRIKRDNITIQGAGQGATRWNQYDNNVTSWYVAPDNPKTGLTQIGQNVWFLDMELNNRNGSSVSGYHIHFERFSKGGTERIYLERGWSGVCVEGCGEHMLIDVDCNIGQSRRAIMADENNSMIHVKTQVMEPITATITAVSDYSGTVAGTTRFTAASHGIDVARTVFITGLSNYATGLYTATPIDSNSFYIAIAYAAETPSGAEVQYQVAQALPYANGGVCKWISESNTVVIRGLQNAAGRGNPDRGCKYGILIENYDWVDIQSTHIGFAWDALVCVKPVAPVPCDTLQVRGYLDGHPDGTNHAFLVEMGTDVCTGSALASCDFDDARMSFRATATQFNEEIVKITIPVPGGAVGNYPESRMGVSKLNLSECYFFESQKGHVLIEAKFGSVIIRDSIFQNANLESSTHTFLKTTQDGDTLHVDNCQFQTSSGTPFAVIQTAAGRTVDNVILNALTIPDTSDLDLRLLSTTNQIKVDNIVRPQRLAIALDDQKNTTASSEDKMLDYVPADSVDLTFGARTQLTHIGYSNANVRSAINGRFLTINFVDAGVIKHAATGTYGRIYLASGTDRNVLAGDRITLYCDGTDYYELVTSLDDLGLQGAILLVPNGVAVNGTTADTGQFLAAANAAVAAGVPLQFLGGEIVYLTGDLTLPAGLVLDFSRSAGRIRLAPGVELGLDGVSIEARSDQRIFALDQTSQSITETAPRASWTITSIADDGSNNILVTTDTDHTLTADNGVAISGVADAGASGITVTTSALHNLTAGDEVTLSGTTDYNGTYVVDAVPTTTSFRVNATFTQTRTGTAKGKRSYVRIRGTTGFNGKYLVETVPSADTFTVSLLPGLSFPGVESEGSADDISEVEFTLASSITGIAAGDWLYFETDSHVVGYYQTTYVSGTAVRLQLYGSDEVLGIKRGNVVHMPRLTGDADLAEIWGHWFGVTRLDDAVSGGDDLDQSRLINAAQAFADQINEGEASHGKFGVGVPQRLQDATYTIRWPIRLKGQQSQLRAPNAIFDRPCTVKTISAVSNVGGNARFASTAHGYAVGDVIKVYTPDHDGEFTVTAVDTDWFECGRSFNASIAGGEAQRTDQADGVIVAGVDPSDPRRDANDRFDNLPEGPVLEIGGVWAHKEGATGWGSNMYAHSGMCGVRVLNTLAHVKVKNTRNFWRNVSIEAGVQGTKVYHGRHGADGGDNLAAGLLAAGCYVGNFEVAPDASGAGQSQATANWYTESVMIYLEGQWNNAGSNWESGLHIGGVDGIECGPAHFGFGSRAVVRLRPEHSNAPIINVRLRGFLDDAQTLGTGTTDYGIWFEDQGTAATRGQINRFMFTGGQIDGGDMAGIRVDEAVILKECKIHGVIQTPGKHGVDLNSDAIRAIDLDLTIRDAAFTDSAGLPAYINCTGSGTMRLTIVHSGDGAHTPSHAVYFDDDAEMHVDYAVYGMAPNLYSDASNHTPTWFCRHCDTDFTTTLTSLAINITDNGGGTVLCTTTSPHGLSNGNVVIIEGTTDYDANRSITVVSSTSFSVSDTYTSDQSGTATPQTQAISLPLAAHGHTVKLIGAENARVNQITFSSTESFFDGWHCRLETPTAKRIDNNGAVLRTFDGNNITTLEGRAVALRFGYGNGSTQRFYAAATA